MLLPPSLPPSLPAYVWNDPGGRRATVEPLWLASLLE